MTRLRNATLIALIAAFLAVPSVAAADEVVPPGNSAAMQYTETFPTSSGEAKANGEINGDRTPSKVLGKKKAHELESKGAAGKAVATLTADTAAPQPDTTGGESGGGEEEGKKETGAGSAKSGGGGGNGGGKSSSSGAAESGGAATPQNVTVPQPSGSSGIGEVLGQATGSGAGGLGIFLPLVLLGTLAWGLLFLWRQRRPVA